MPINYKLDGFDKEFIESSLNLIQDLTGLSVILYLEKLGFFVSAGCLTSFCKEICKNVDIESCCKLNPKDLTEPEMCKAGLWFRNISFEFEDGSLGYVSIGHVRVEGRENESKIRLLEYCQSCSASPEESSLIQNEFRKIIEVNEEALYNPIISKLNCFEKFSKNIYSLVGKQNRKIAKLESITARTIHQLRTPIQAMLGEAWYISKKVDDPELVKSLRIVMNELKKLSLVSENLMSLYLDNLDSMKNNNIIWTDLDIISEVNQSIALFQREAKHKGLTICPPKVNDTKKKIKASKSHIQLLFHNLIQNAVKYSYVGVEDTARGQIEIILTSNEEGYFIEIKNYGAGILEEEIEKIFEEGYRGKLAIDISRSGSGIGLAVAKRIADLHNGCIAVSSNRLNQSNKNLFINVFTVFLPFDARREIDEKKNSMG